MASWNAGGGYPLQKEMEKWLPPAANADIVVVGVQQCGYSQLASQPKKNRGFGIFRKDNGDSISDSDPENVRKFESQLELHFGTRHT